MKDIHLLKNKGIAIIGKKPDNLDITPRTIIVLGAARGGTSLVAGTLHHLGIFMGENATSPVFEDSKLAIKFEEGDGDFQAAANIIKQYNDRFDVWGYKRPDMISNLDQSIKMFRNPICIVIFKDILSIAYRSQVADKVELILNMQKSLGRYSEVIRFLSEQEPYCLLISYDKVVSNVLDFLPTIASFCGIKVSEEQKVAIEDFIQPDPSSYLDAARTTHTKGRLDKVTEKVISGWARYVNNERIAEVVLFVDDKEIGRTKALEFREDLLKDNVHEAGKCAFYFTGFPRGAIKKGSVVRARVIDDIQDLRNSPVTYEEG